MTAEVNVYPPERMTKKRLVTLPEDQWEMIDGYAKALGLSRSSFLQVYFDTFSDQFRTFTMTLLDGTTYFRELLAQKQRVKNGRAIGESLGTRMTSRAR